MTDIASLGIEISTDGVAKASADLDKLVDSGQKAEASAKSTGSAWDKAASDISRDTQEIVRQLQALNAKQDTTSKQMAVVGTAVTNAATAFSAAAVSITSYQAKADALNTTQKNSADSAKQAGAAARAQADDLATLLGKIDPTVAALGRLDDLEKKLGQQKALGNLDSETFTQYQTKIDQTRAALGKYDDAQGKVGISAKQTAAALRGVPAQFTDIVTSLQGGQAPLTVFLQQGGQLKDMFGGAGNAAKALGGYVLGLVNPFTVAAAAVAALTVVYAKGSSEATAFNTALITSGNAAGTSAPQLATLAASISSTVGTTGAAAEVLTQLAQSGQVASGAFEEITKAALEMQDATGKAASATVAEFVKIGKDPVAAAKDLNDQYNFLTQSVYAQIVALKEQGDNIGATKLLTDTYADTVRTRAAEITANLGLIERGWLAVKNAAKAAGDATLSVGREQTDEQKAAALQAKINDPSSYSTLPIIGADNPNLAQTGTTKAQDQAQLDYLRLQIDANATLAKYNGDNAQAQKDAIVATDKITAQNNANLTVEEKRNKEIREYLQSVQAIKKVSPDSPLVSDSAVAKGIQNIKDKNKDPKAAAGSVDLSGFNDQKNALAAIVDEYNNAEKELDANRKAGLLSQQQYTDQKLLLLQTENEETQNAYAAEISALEAVRDASSTTAAQRIQINEKIADAQAAATKAAKDNASQQQVISTENIGALNKEKTAIQSYVDALNEKVVALQKSGARAVANVSQGSRQGQLSTSLDNEDTSFAKDSLSLTKQKTTLSDTEYTAKVKALSDEHDAATKQILKNYDDITAANEDWTNGAKAGFEDYLEKAQDVAGTTRDLVSGVFTSLTDGISDSIASSIVAGDSLRDSLAKVATTIETQLISSLVKLGIQYLVNATLGQSIAAASIGVSAATAAATAAVWAPAAALASLASFGANSVPATAALTSTTLLASTLAAGSAIGFESGGYTGDGGKSEVAGIVHKGEYVIDAASTSRLGVSTLDAMRSGNMQASANASAYSGSGSSGGNKGNTYVTFKEDASKAGTASTTQSGDDTYITGFVSNIAQQGDAATMLENTYGLKRVGR